MPKDFIKRYLPEPHKIKDHKHLRIFGDLIHNQNLWHLNRTSVPIAMSVGLFSALIPIPFQMILAAFLAILFHANLPLSVVLVWLTNPITMPPIFYFTYKIGALLLQIPPRPFHIELSWEWISTQLGLIWQPLLLGSFLCAVIAAVLGNILVRIVWRVSVARRWRSRSNDRIKR